MQFGPFLCGKIKVSTKKEKCYTKLWRREKNTIIGYTKINLKIHAKVGIIIDRAKIFEAIEIERERQEKLHPKPVLKESESPEVKALAHYLWLTDMLAVLIEEIGEVGKALQGEGDLEEELIQVASVAVRWLENIK